MSCEDNEFETEIEEFTGYQEDINDEDKECDEFLDYHILEDEDGNPIELKFD